MNEEQKIDEALKNMGSSLEEFDEYTRMGIDEMQRGAIKMAEVMNGMVGAPLGGRSHERAAQLAIEAEQRKMSEKLAAAFNEGRAAPASIAVDAGGNVHTITSEEYEEAIRKLRAASLPPQHPEADELVEGLQHNGISSVTARVRGKIVYQGCVDSEEIRQALAAVMIQHRRKFHLTIRMVDGSKQRYRGNKVQYT
jgi:hypothetical protein